MEVNKRYKVTSGETLTYSAATNKTQGTYINFTYCVDVDCARLEHTSVTLASSVWRTLEYISKDREFKFHIYIYIYIGE